MRYDLGSRRFYEITERFSDDVADPMAAANQLLDCAQ
jgi:hypothetical protein